MAVAEEGGDGTVERARRRRLVTGDVELVVLRDANEVGAAVAEQLGRAASAGGHIALTGGTTPERAYTEAAEREPDWSKTEIWWSDERCVPHQGRARQGAGSRGLRARARRHCVRLRAPGSRQGRSCRILVPECTDAAGKQTGAPGGGRAGTLRRSGHAEHSGFEQRESNRLRAHRRRQGRSLASRFWHKTGPGDAGQPRPISQRHDHCNPRSRCRSQASRLTRPSLYVEVRREDQRGGQFFCKRRWY